MEMTAESRESLLAILDACPIGIGRVKNRVIEWANEWLCRVVGYTQEEVRGLSARAFYRSDEEYCEAGEELYRAGRAEVRMVKKDGSLLDVLLRASPFHDGSHLFTATDITKQKQAENMLRFTQFSVDNALDVIVWTNKKAGITYVNDSACKSSGYTRDELLSMTVFDINPEMSKEKWDELWGLRKQGEGFLVEGKSRRKDGTTYPMEVSSKYLRYEDNDYILAVIRDITERKRAEDALRRKAAFLEALVNTSFDGILVVDSEGKKIFQNQKTAELWRIPQHVLDRGNLAQQQHVTNVAKDPEQFAERLMYLYAHPEETSLDEVELVDGTILERYSSPVLGQDGEYYGRIWGFHDITERKRAEEALRESEKRYRSLFDDSPAALMEADGSAAKAHVDALCVPGDVRKYIDDHPEDVRESLALMRITDANKATLDLYEATDIDTFREAFRSFLAHAPIEMLANAFLAITEGVVNQGRREEVRLTRSGRKIYVDAKWTVVPGHEGTCDKIFFSDIDVTKRKEAEEALRKSEEKYRDMFERAAEGIFQSTVEGRFITVNPAYARMLGYDSPEDLLAHVTNIPAQLYVNPGARLRDTTSDETCDDLGRSEMQLFRKDGMKIWVSANVRTVRGAEGKVLCFEGTAVDITERKQAQEKLESTLNNLRRAIGGTIQAIVQVVEMRDPYTAGHQRRVADLARSLATGMRLPSDTIEGIRMAAVIHDIGKISVPAEILCKPGKLTGNEFDLIRDHPVMGYDILKDVEFPWPIAEIIYQHHERLDGSGYPRGLKGDDVLLEARIIALADVVEAMASHRPFRPARGIDAALDEIRKNSGILYDPAVVDTCLKLFKEKGYTFV